MAKEIERKFLVINDSYKTLCNRSLHIIQGYIYPDKRAVVRIRIADDRGFLTIKGENLGATRDEWEYEIPVDDAKNMLAQLAVGNIIDKTRYIVDFDGFRWEVDEFHSPVTGLVVAEIELDNAGTKFPVPDFIGDEVTGDPSYYNSSMTGLS